MLHGGASQRNTVSVPAGGCSNPSRWPSGSTGGRGSTEPQGVPGATGAAGEDVHVAVEVALVRDYAVREMLWPTILRNGRSASSCRPESKGPVSHELQCLRLALDIRTARARRPRASSGGLVAMQDAARSGSTDPSGRDLRDGLFYPLGKT